MSTGALSGDVEARLRWAIWEAVVIAGIFLFWVVISLAVSAILSVIAYVLLVFEFEPLRVVYTFTEHGHGIWGAVIPLASATTGLYVLARAGTVIVDRYHTGPEQ